MSELTQVLNEVRNKITQYQGKEMNEQNTKTALIDPVLRALGWDVGNLEEVSQEYKRRPKDKPVDYALFLLRTPKLFVEAKAMGQSLDAPKWANQIMGYAAVGGIKWVVMSNGDEYRIYNACVEVPVEEKLFRSVRLSDPMSPTEETLVLLSKDRIRDNDIEVLWKVILSIGKCAPLLNNCSRPTRILLSCDWSRSECGNYPRRKYEQA